MIWSQVYDYGANVTVQSEPDRVIVRTEGTLCDTSHRPSAEGEKFSLEYTLTEQGLAVKGGLISGAGTGAVLILPVIRSGGETAVSGCSAVIGGRLRITPATEIVYEGPVFNPAPGFEAENLRIRPGRDGLFDVMISVEEVSG